MRIRSIKPEFFTHEGLFDLEESTGLPVRIVFIGLWCVADREGRFRWEPRRLGVQIMPYSTRDFALILNALESAGFVQKYGANGEFGLIPSFLKHQCINAREAKSTLPDPENTVHAQECTDRENESADREMQDRCMHVHARGEGKGREMEGKGAEPSSSLVSLDVALANGGSCGATPEMIQKWWHKREAVGWMNGNTLIRKWQNDLSAFASSWRSNDGAKEAGRNAGPPKTPPNYHAHKAPDASAADERMAAVADLLKARARGELTEEQERELNQEPELDF